jgi:hypothetical protein
MCLAEADHDPLTSCGRVADARGERSSARGGFDGTRPTRATPKRPISVGTIGSTCVRVTHYGDRVPGVTP